jgi:hypothetical protein
MTRESNGFKVGDVIHNGWAGEENCYSIIVGRSSIKTGQFSTTSCYKQRLLYKGKLVKHVSLMDIRQERQTKIGHIDYEGAIVTEMQKLIEATQLTPPKGTERK